MLSACFTVSSGSVLPARRFVVVSPLRCAIERADSINNAVQIKIFLKIKSRFIIVLKRPPWKNVEINLQVNSAEFVSGAPFHESPKIIISAGLLTYSILETSFPSF
jgi:hypothetical protein